MVYVDWSNSSSNEEKKTNLDGAPGQKGSVAVRGGRDNAKIGMEGREHLDPLSHAREGGFRDFRPLTPYKGMYGLGMTCAAMKLGPSVAEPEIPFSRRKAITKRRRIGFYLSNSWN